MFKLRLIGQHQHFVTEFGQARHGCQVLQSEQLEEVFRSFVDQGAPRNIEATRDADQPFLDEVLEHAPAVYPANSLYALPGSRLLVGHHGECLDRSSTQAIRTLLEQAAHRFGVLGRGTVLPASSHLDKPHPPRLALGLQLLQRRGDLLPAGTAHSLGQAASVYGFTRGKYQSLYQWLEAVYRPTPLTGLRVVPGPGVIALQRGVLFDRHFFCRHVRRPAVSWVQFFYSAFFSHQAVAPF